MHELAVTESILEIALRHGNTAGINHITDLYLVIGQLASIVDDSVQFYWDIISKDTLAEGAQLHFRRIPIELLCANCDHRYKPGSDNFDCPECSSNQIKVISGNEFYLESIGVV